MLRQVISAPGPRKPHLQTNGAGQKGLITPHLAISPTATLLLLVGPNLGREGEGGRQSRRDGMAGASFGRSREVSQSAFVLVTFEGEVRHGWGWVERIHSVPRIGGRKWLMTCIEKRINTKSGASLRILKQKFWSRQLGWAQRVRTWPTPC